LKGRKVTCTGDTIEEAKNNACKELNLDEENIEFQIIQEPGKKKFGLFGGSTAKVKATEIIDPYKTAYNYLNNIIQTLNLNNLKNIKLEAEKTEQGAMFDIIGEDAGLLIGHKGETIQALQYLTNLVANKNSEAYFRVSLDVANYRRKREDTLRNLATSLAHKVLHTKKDLSLEPMNPYERRIIHTQIQNISGVTSWSEGKGKFRHVIIGVDNKINTIEWS